MRKTLLNLAITVMALAAPLAAAANPACQACMSGCDAAYGHDEESLVNCYAGCFDSSGAACMITIG